MVFTKREIAPEFPWDFKTEELEDRPVTVKIEATEEQCKALEKRLDALSVQSVKATLTLQRLQGFVIEVTGKLVADVTQKCVVTLEPVESHIEEEFDGYYSERTDAISFAKAKREKILENQDPEVPFLDEKDDPEPVIDGKIDLGELTTQYLCLAMPPYPHKEGVRYDIGDDDEAAINASRKLKNPFAKLEAVKKILEGERE